MIPLAPKQILQNMEVPRHAEDHPWPGKSGLFVLGSLEPVRISLVSQQTRAINLIYALACEGRLKKGSRLAIIGGGPAGLTAAVAATFLGGNVTVFESASRPMNVFCPNAGNDRRYAHPYAENWPYEKFSGDMSAALPFLKWKGGTPANVAKQLVDGLLSLKKDSSFPVYVETVCEIDPGREREWKVNYHAVRWDWKKWSGPLRKKKRKEPPLLWNVERNEREVLECDLVIFAIGFGTDDRGSGQPGYWKDDWKSQWSRIARNRRKKVLVSGGGDGGLIDAINASLISTAERCPHRKLTKALLDYNLDANLHKDLIKFEDRIHRGKVPDSELLFRYQKLKEDHSEALLKIDQKLGLDGQKVRSVFFATDTLHPLRGRNFPINRFLAWRLLEHGKLHHMVGKLETLPKQRRALFIKSSRSSKGVCKLIRNAFVIERHGPSSALKLHYPQIWSACEKHLKSKNELDQTRVPAWPQNFFNDEPARLQMSNSPRRLERPKEETHSITISERSLQPQRAEFNSLEIQDIFSLSLGDESTESLSLDDSLWVRFDTNIKFHLKRVPPGFSLEHRLSASEPMRLSVTKSSKEICLARLDGNPPWAVAYRFAKTKKKILEIAMTGDPSGLIHSADSTGFPIFGDMHVHRIDYSLIFKGLIPVVGENHAVGVYTEPIRRLTYEAEDISVPETPGSGPVFFSTEQLSQDETWKARFSWKSASGGPLPQGFFYGVRWDKLIRFETEN